MNIRLDNRLTKVQQIVNAFISDIDTGKLKGGSKLPSINEFSELNKVGRDTIEKAYKQLKSKGYIESIPSWGHFVQGINQQKPSILLIFNKLSSFKKIIYYSFLEEIGSRARVDLQIHHYNPKLLKEILENSVGKYDYYVVMPHFYADADIEECVNICRMVLPQGLLLDKCLPQLGQACKAVYQNFRQDVYEALLKCWDLIGKYQSITLIFPRGTHHPHDIITGIKSFSEEQGMRFHLTDDVEPGNLRRYTIYIVIEEEVLARLLKEIRAADLVLGQEVGIISFNETVMKELLDISVISTDFEKMGRTAARLVLGSEIKQLRNPFKVVLRGSL
jgi:DNA-binding transcriptional regulator YhcF (GntR family)